jgi:hypothetical protein
MGLNNYGAHHRRLRAAMLPLAPGSLCTRCGRPIEAGQAVDLDHTDDGTAYLGFAHASCNRRAAAVKGNKARRPGAQIYAPARTPHRSIPMNEPCAIGVDIAHDRGHTSAVIATRVQDGRVLIELHYLAASDTAQAVANLCASRPGLVATVVDPQSPAATLLAPLKDLGVRVTEPTSRDVALAHGLFLDELKAGRLRYVDHEALTAAVQHAMARPLAGAEALERRRVDVDASPMTAAEVAVWALVQPARHEHSGEVFVNLADFLDDDDNN